MVALEQSWSIIVLCFNEKGTLSPVVEQTREVLKELTRGAYEILVVDDGSTDGCVEVLNRLETEVPELRRITHPRNLGIGQALRSGYAAARFENICAIPADGQFDLRELLAVANLPERTFASFRRGVRPQYSVVRQLLSRFNRLLNFWLFGFDVKDVNWVAVFKKEALEGVGIQLESVLVESEIMIKLLLAGYRCVEVPSVYHLRVAGVSQGASLKSIGLALRETVQLCRVVRAFKKRVAADSLESGSPPSSGSSKGRPGLAAP